MTNSEDMNASDNLGMNNTMKGGSEGTTINGSCHDGFVNGIQAATVPTVVGTVATTTTAGSISYSTISSNYGSEKNHRKKSFCASSVGDSTEQGNVTGNSTYAIPFITIRGEKVIQVIQTSEGILVISNYRLFIQGKENQYNIPLGLVDQVECRDIFFLHINCKDARCIRCTFPNNETVIEAMRKIQHTLLSAKCLEEYFAFSFYEKMDTDHLVSDEMKLQLGSDLPPPTTSKERFESEIRRMEFNVQNPWRISFENEDYELCSSYPRHIIVPNSIDKKKLEQVACFRSARRFPAVVWRHRGNGAVICRCSQPEVGWFGWRSTEDEELVQNIIQACAYDRWPQTGELSVPLDSITSPSSNFNGGHMELLPESTNTVKKLLILDARSYTTAVANRARGGGCECLEYYPNCEIQFMNLANIHSIRKSFTNVRQLCALPSDQANWFSQLEGCKWLQHMSGLMKAAVTVVTAIENDGRPVMVHCSDGWDRTPQIVALAEILLDPYYRSLEGFEVLVEREWLDFGHKFGDRCGQGVGSEDGNERCPVFLQWLDCLHQLLQQFPTAFEFNMSFIVKLVQHTYSNLFGTFLCNTSKERENHEINQKTISVWRFLRAPRNYDKFRNSLFKSCDKVLWPSCEVRDLRLWSQVYLGYENPPPSLTEVVNPSQESSPAPSVAEGEALDSSYKSHASKGRSSSYENLTQLHPSSKGHQRKLSDSSIYGPLDIDTDGCMSKDVLEKSSREDDEKSHESHHLHDSSLNGGVGIVGEILGDCENSENEEDNEGNSEGKSESTVINTLKLKSIESSTDTLVPEFGFPPDTKVFCNGEDRNQERKWPQEPPKFNENCLGTTEPKTEYFSHGIEDTLTDIEIAMLNSSLNDSGDQVQSNHLEGPTPEKLLSEESEDLNHLNATDNFHGHQCTVCEQSKAVLRHVHNHDNFHITNGLGGNPSTTISYATSFNGPITNGITSTNNFLIKERQTLDVDGLTYFHDETQIRLNTILSECQAQIEMLQRDVQIYRNALREQVCHRCPPSIQPIGDIHEDSVSISGSEVVSQSSEVSSSFETIDHADTFPPLWVPDFAVTGCMSCNVKFSLGRRKHHCRACGRVFCSDCSDNSISLPHEQIFDPSRVCHACFLKHRVNNSSNNGQNNQNLDIITNGGDGSGHSSFTASAAVSKPVSVPNTSVPFTNNSSHITPYHQLSGPNSHHAIFNNTSSTKSKFGTGSSQKVPEVHGSRAMNGHVGGRIISKPQ